ncbi:MAG: hypothetical protein Q7S98_06765 [Deltaproteobacteria bacterium]|nr:hypothetical protein [Deltaproteobacteria bacterium]
MAKIRICTESKCQNAQTTQGYCRLHYLKNWKQLKEAAKKKAADKLNRYVEGICKKSPENYMGDIKKDLKSEKSFDRAADGGGFSEEIEQVLEDMGYQDDTTLDKLISNIKVQD